MVYNKTLLRRRFRYMTSKNIIDTLSQIIDKQDISIASVARRMGKTSQALNKQLNNNDIKLSTLLCIISALHCNIDITITDRATGREYKL